MKTGLKRIEATLHDLGNRENVTVEASESPKRAVSFRISVSGKEATTDTAISDDVESIKPKITDNQEIETPKDITVEQNLFSSHHSVETFPAQ